MSCPCDHIMMTHAWTGALLRALPLFHFAPSLSTRSTLLCHIASKSDELFTSCCVSRVRRKIFSVHQSQSHVKVKVLVGICMQIEHIAICFTVLVAMQGCSDYTISHRTTCEHEAPTGIHQRGHFAFIESRL